MSQKVTSSGPVLPVILSGGSGTRLWPLSRSDRPKQFIALTGPNTMLQMTCERVADPALFLPPVVVASPAHAEIVEAQLGERAASLSSLILEPHARNTAPAIALAALAATPDQLLLIMPSDHVVGEVASFHAAVRSAAPFASEGWLVTFGIRATRPETAYGYIKRGDPLGEGVFSGTGFVEKPDRDTASAYVADGCYDWNGGIFLFRADAYLDALAAHAPDILAAATRATDGARREGVRLYPDAAGFAELPSISIDYAVMEKVERFAVVQVAMDWSDVGSWDALHEISAQDSDGTAASGNVTALDAKNCLLRSTGPRLVAIGVEDLVVIATPDAVLVVPRSQSQRVKEAVEALREQGGNEALGV